MICCHPVCQYHNALSNLVWLSLLACCARPTGSRSCEPFAPDAPHTIVHDTVLATANKCSSFQNDVYQRFSGYVVKHRMGQLCDTAFGVFERLRRLALSTGCGSTEASGDFDTGAAAHALALDLERLDLEVDGTLTDTNAQGDGQLKKFIGEHLLGMASNLEQASQISTSPERSKPDWAQMALQVLDTVHKLLQLSFDHIQDAVTYNIGHLNVSDLPRFFSLLDSFPAAVPVQVRRPRLADVSGQCQDVPFIYYAQHVFDPVADPPAWQTRDVSGLLAQRPCVQKILFAVSKSVPLAYNMIAVLPRAQVGAQELTAEYQRMFQETGGSSAPVSQSLQSVKESSCSGTGLSYSPAHCLFDLGWGMMMFSLGTEPPFDGVLAVSEMSQKSHTTRPSPFVQPVVNESQSLDHLIDLVDSVYKSLNTPSPDILFLSPMVGNCLTFRKLGPSRRDQGSSGTPQLTPKLVWVPLNPIVPPPWKLAPNFTIWHENWLGKQVGTENIKQAAWWFAQCSLESAVQVLGEQGYVLLHVEHAFAVFILRGLWPSIKHMVWTPPFPQHADASSHPGNMKSYSSLYDHWLRGWFCSPIAPTLFALEASAGVDLSILDSHTASLSQKRHALCQFIRGNELPLSKDHDSYCEEVEMHSLAVTHPQSWRAWQLHDLPEERGKAHHLESSGRGRCLSELGFCECFPPHRGRYCESSEPGIKDKERKFNAVLHYLVGDRERLLKDFTRTLPLLWERFNSKFDYPVVVFHDGMAPESRKRILEASSNRIWFAYVADYSAVPAYLKGRLELELGGYGLGYRGMCRFRSGPMFMQPVMQQFDYAWTLDTDGYFPAEIHKDPFEEMWRHDYVYGYSHVSRDQASAVQHFWEFCRLYLESKGVDPKRTKIMRRITDALVLRDTYWHEWNRVLFMNDIEITKLAWFRGTEYQDFFRYLDSVGGFWLYRWGDHAVRTIAVALWLDEGKLMKMGVPYGHQNTCRCGEEHPDEVCVRSSLSDWWSCTPRSNAKLGTEVASGEIGTVHENILFGGS